MKNQKLLLSLALAFIMCTAQAATEPTNNDKEIIKTAALSLSVHEASSSDLIESSSYNLKTDKLSISLKQNVAYIQVKDKDGNIEFQLPIDSKQIHLSLDQFEKGSYEVFLLTYNLDQVISMSLSKTE